MFAPRVTSRLTFLVSLVILLAGYLAFAPTLERYPPPYFDDSFYNYPAIRALDGLPFAWPETPTAPYAQLTWGYHAIFYPKLAILIFKFFGVSQFTARITQYTGAFLAVAILCFAFHRRGFRWAPLLLAIGWLGDRSYMEVMYARMDGIALFFLACALVAFVRALETERVQDAFWSALLAGMAAGFHPSTGGFFVLMVATYLYFWTAKRIQMLVACGAALAIPLGASLLLVAPYFREAAAQFLYNRRIATYKGFAANAVNLVNTLRWSRWYYLALVAAVLLVVVPWLLSQIVTRSKKNPLALALCIFAMGGTLALVSTSMFPYYLIFFSIWPLAATLTLLETSPDTRPPLNTVIAIGLLAICWIPGFMWNGFRWREARVYGRLADPAQLLAMVHAHVPAGAPIKMSPPLYIIGRGLGRDLIPYALPTPEALPPNAWLVLLDIDLNYMGGRSAPGLRERPLVSRAPLFPGIPTSETLTILGPLPAAAEAAHRP